jgi:DNA-binding MarR family transcriptional regulator
MSNVLAIQSKPAAVRFSDRSPLGEKMPNHGTNPQAAVNTAALVRLLGCLKIAREATGNPELQLQTMNVFLYIASRHPNEVPQGEIERVLGMVQTTVSRNCAYLAKGSSTGLGGYKLIEVFEDIDYRKRKLTRLTKKGAEVAAALSNHIIGR